MIKKLAKVIGIAGGAAAVLWAMRDRFVSVAISREPETPTFRATPKDEPELSIDTVDGIGPVFAGRLKVAGLDSVNRLAAASPDTVAAAAGVSGARARSWIEQAEALS